MVWLLQLDTKIVHTGIRPSTTWCAPRGTNQLCDHWLAFQQNVQAHIISEKMRPGYCNKRSNRQHTICAYWSLKIWTVQHAQKIRFISYIARQIIPSRQAWYKRLSCFQTSVRIWKTCETRDVWSTNPHLDFRSGPKRGSQCRVAWTCK